MIIAPKIQILRIIGIYLTTAILNILSSLTYFLVVVFVDAKVGVRLSVLSLVSLRFSMSDLI
jgi:hypothetical protein